MSETAWQRSHGGRWALILPHVLGLEVLTEEGEVMRVDGPCTIDRLAHLATDHAVFTSHWRELLMRTGMQRWEVKKRRGRTLEVSTDHRVSRDRDVLRVRVLPKDIFRGVEDAGLAFATYVRWLRERGVFINPSRCTWSTLNNQLVTNTINWPADRPWQKRLFFCPDDLAQLRAGYYGGRKQSQPGRYRSCVHYDMNAAFPHALGTMEWPRRLIRYEGNERDRYNRTFDPERVGIARVSVLVPPELVHAPLPVAPALANRQLTYYPRDQVHGWYATNELRMAFDLGAVIEVHELYDDARRVREPAFFAPWLAEVTKARRLPHGADRLAKTHANSVWGTFVSTDATTSWHRYESLNPRIQQCLRKVPGRNYNARSYWPAAWVAASVRVRLYEEALAPMGHAALYADTDGVIGPYYTPRTMTLGTAPGTWKRARMPRVEVWDTQAYRYCCAGCGDDHPSWHVKVAGVRMPSWADIGRRRRPVEPSDEEESLI